MTATPRPGRIGVPGFGRIPISSVSPVVECGAYPAKAVTGEAVPVRATIFREGHEAVAAAVILTSPDGHTSQVEMTQVEPMGLDIWQAWVRPDAEGDWWFRIEAYGDRWRTWRHNARIKLPAGLDVALVCAEATGLLGEAIMPAQAADDAFALATLRRALAALRPDADLADALAIVDDPELDAAMVRHCPRALLTPSRDFPLQVDRRRALFSSWYEFFPRSQQAVQHADGSWTSGTLRSSYPMLERIARMGFDVAYLPPIHPVGTTFRKGRNNTLNPQPGDPGSPWAIGSSAGGHDAVHPDLGTLDDFDAFVDKAHALGLEVALDFALQASPDHPWVHDHPEFFSHRPDGSIAYAENPPKKYQDIYPLNFDNDPPAIYAEALRLVNFWIGHGVRIFRVDNPHTKPVNFWAWLLHEVHVTHPDVLFQAEAFTRPAMMQALGKVGFHLGYTYFAWRHTRSELESYLRELSTQTDAFFRPNFFVNTPDINPMFTESGAPAAFAIRVILAGTMSPSWGMYSGFELFEHERPVPGSEEYLNSERFEYRPRNFDAEPNLNLLVGRLNQIRREHPALQQLRRTTIHSSTSDELVVFSKSDQDDTVIVVCSLNPTATVEAQVSLDLGALGMAAGQRFDVRDELTGSDFSWGEANYVRLWPSQPAHILHVRG